MATNQTPIGMKENRRVGKNIESLRNYFHMSQQDVVDLTGISNAIISRAEHGKAPINTDCLETLCMLFNVTPSELMGWAKLTYRQSPEGMPKKFQPTTVGKAPEPKEPPVKVTKVSKESDKEQLHGILCDLLHETYVKKNHDYGDSYSKLRKEYPVLICIHLEEKLNRLKSLINNPKDAKVNESIEDTLMDLANYALLELTERNSKK